MFPHATSSLTCALLARSHHTIPDSMVDAARAMPAHWYQAERLYQAIAAHVPTRTWEQEHEKKVAKAHTDLSYLHSGHSMLAQLALAPDLALSGARLAALAQALGWRCIHLLDPFSTQRSWTPSHAVATYLLCEDGSAIACLNGAPLLLPDDTAVFESRITEPFAAILEALAQAPSWLVLDPHTSLEDTLDTAARGWDFDAVEGDDVDSLLDVLSAAYEDASDPPFDPNSADEPAWDNTHKLRIPEHAAPLFAALAQHLEAEVSFTVVAADPDGDHAGYIYEDEQDGEGIDVDLFLEALPLVAPIAEVTGATWQYNDGAHDRQSGYCASSNHYPYTLTMDSLGLSAHQMMAHKAAFRDKALHDPVFAPLRERLLDAMGFHHNAHDDTMADATA